MKDTEIQKQIVLADELRDKKGLQKEAVAVLEGLLAELPQSLDYYLIVGIKLSALYRDSISYSKSLELLNKLQNIALKLNKQLFQADILRSIAFIQIHTNQINEALKNANDAKRLVRYTRKDNVDEVRANIYAVIGNIFFTQEKFNQALSSYKSSIRYAKKANFVNRIITVSSDIANVFIKQNKVSYAQKYLMKLLADSKQHYRIALPQIYIRLANINYLQNNKKEAISTLQTALTIARKEGWKRDIAEILQHLSDKRLEQNVNKREEMLKEAMSIYLSLGLVVKVESIKKIMVSF